jgi:hypothetical protein
MVGEEREEGSEVGGRGARDYGPRDQKTTDWGWGKAQSAERRARGAERRTKDYGLQADWTLYYLPRRIGKRSKGDVTQESSALNLAGR